MRTFAFIDASNLFYGGEKSLGWKIDYRKLRSYLTEKYNVSVALYFGGVETHNFHYDVLTHDSVPLDALESYLTLYLQGHGQRLNEAELLLFSRHLSRVRFYHHLREFGYSLVLKPVKSYHQDDGTTKRKANCDVDMTFYLMKLKEDFDRAVILSGDGDFLPVLKYLKSAGKEILILARGPRTAQELRLFAGGNFRDFVRLERAIKFEKNKEDGHTKYPPHV